MASKRTNRAECEPEWCPVELALQIIGGLWKVQIVNYLLDGTKRYGELKRLVVGISEKMLSQQLRELEQDGVVTRQVFPEVPPRVEYTLTPAGRGLEQVLLSLHAWSLTNIPERTRQVADLARTRDARKQARSEGVTKKTGSRAERSEVARRVIGFAPRP